MAPASDSPPHPCEFVHPCSAFAFLWRPRLAAVEIGSGLGHVQRGWQETDERILFGFIKAFRRGDYDAALEMAPVDEAMADWPAAPNEGAEGP